MRMAPQGVIQTPEGDQGKKMMMKVAPLWTPEGDQIMKKKTAAAAKRKKK